MPEPLKPFDAILTPDERWGFFSIHASDLHRISQSLDLPQSVPEETRKLFQQAQHILVYAYFQYSMISTALMQAHLALESALRLRLRATAGGSARKSEHQRALLNELNAAIVEYLVIGGTAMRALRIDRETSDLDLLLGGRPENVIRVAPLLQARFAFKDGRNVADMMRPGNMLREQGVDILSSIEGFNFDDAFQRSRPLRLDGCTLQLPSIEDQIALKRISMATSEDRFARYRDAHDIDLLVEHLARTA